MHCKSLQGITGTLQGTPVKFTDKPCIIYVYEMPCANCRENIYKVFPVEFTENPWQVYGESLTSLQGIPAKFTVRHSVQYVYMKPMYKLQGKPVKAIPCRIHRLFLLNLQEIPVDFKNWRPTQMIII